MEDRYVAAMVLAAVGDAMGYKNGDWEFCFDGTRIHKELESMGGVGSLRIEKPNWIVSDDTVLLLSTAEALAHKSRGLLEELYSEMAWRYQRDFSLDMSGRAGGITTAKSCAMLKPREAFGWRIPFNAQGGGCGAAMRSMCIGLRYPDYEDKDCLQKLIAVSVESGRMTHNHPTGYLGSFASAFFAALAVKGVPVRQWGSLLVTTLEQVWTYVEKEGLDVLENQAHWGYFVEQWNAYLKIRNLLRGDEDPNFPEAYGVKARDEFYTSLAFHRKWGGSSGHDAPMIAYDALLYAGDNWELLCHHAMLHGGDNDSTGVIAGFCYGALFGFRGVPKCNYENVEYFRRLVDAGRKLFELASEDRHGKSTNR